MSACGRRCGGPRRRSRTIRRTRRRTRTPSAATLLTARHAVETLDPDELISREYVLTLAELGIGEPIRELRKHERRRAAGGFRGDPAPVEPLWADGIRAFVLLNQGQFAEAA